MLARCCLTYDVFVAVLNKLAGCYTEQQIFIEAERLYKTLLSLLNENPEERKHDIASGQTFG